MLNDFRIILLHFYSFWELEQLLLFSTLKTVLLFLYNTYIILNKLNVITLQRCVKRPSAGLGRDGGASACRV